MIAFRPKKRNIRLLDDLEQFAREDKRTVNDYIEIILLAHIEGIREKAREDIRRMTQARAQAQG